MYDVDKGNMLDKGYVGLVAKILIWDRGLALGTMSKDVGMSSLPVLVTAPHMSVRGDNTYNTY